MASSENVLPNLLLIIIFNSSFLYGLNIILFSPIRDNIFLWELKKCLVDINMTMFYQRDGKDWTRTFLRSQLFDDDFEVVKIQNPKDNGYQAVDSIYDL